MFPARRLAAKRETVPKPSSDYAHERDEILLADTQQCRLGNY